MAPRDILGWTLDDYQSLVDLATHQGTPPDWPAAVLYSESDFNPRVKNPSTGFQGLIQFSTDNLRAFGLSPAQIDKFTKLTPAQQMKYVDRYFTAWRPATGWESRAQMYQSTFMPGTLKWKGSAPDAVLAKKGQPEYDLNTVLDRDKSGTITVSDLEQRIAERLEQPGSQWLAILAGIDAAGGVLPEPEVALLERAGIHTRALHPFLFPPPISTAAGLAAVVTGSALLGLGTYLALRMRHAS